MGLPEPTPNNRTNAVTTITCAIFLATSTITHYLFCFVVIFDGDVVVYRFNKKYFVVEAGLSVLEMTLTIKLYFLCGLKMRFVKT